jgi:hypothetical protein
VGAPQIRKADVRVVAATDADLEGKVASGAFRAPLLNRLAAYEIWIPPLRDRRDDIGRLLVRFLREELQEIGEAHRLSCPGPGAKPWLPASLVARLANYDWPGNVRQLRNVVRQLVIGNRGRDRAEITPAVERLLLRQMAAAPPPPEPAKASEVPKAGAHASDSPPLDEPTPAPHATTAAAPPPARSAARRKPADVTEGELRETLRGCRFDLAAAAEQLGISRASMYLLIERYPGFRTAGNLDEEEIVRCHRELGGDLAKMSERLEVSERALAHAARPASTKISAQRSISSRVTPSRDAIAAARSVPRSTASTASSRRWISSASSSGDDPDCVGRRIPAGDLAIGSRAAGSPRST